MNYNGLKDIFEEWIKLNLVKQKMSLIDIKHNSFKDIENNKDIIDNLDNEDLIIANLIMTMLSEEKLCKEKNKQSTNFYYNPKLYSNIQEKILKKEKTKKCLMIGIIVIILICILGVAFYSNVQKKEKIKQRNEEIALAEKEMAENIVEDIAKKYNLEDIKYEYIDYDSLISTVYYTTNKYQQLTDKEKLQFLVEISQKTHLKKLFPSISKADGSYYKMAIISDGHVYTDFTFDGKSELMMDKKEIYGMETDFAKTVEENLNSILNDDSSDSSTSKQYYSIQYNYSGCYPNKPHYVCYEKGKCRCVTNP